MANKKIPPSNDEEKDPKPPGLYPTSPISLSSAIVFYNAARQEINERVKFRDQVIISIIAASFAFLAFIDPLNLKNNDPILFDMNLVIKMLLTTVAIFFVAKFMSHYCGYQNAKIGELGFFITSRPALHLKEYGKIELYSQMSLKEKKTISTKTSDVASGSLKLRETIAHWDGWAAKDDELFKQLKKTNITKEQFDKYKKEFSQDNVYFNLIVSFSFLPITIWVAFFLKNGTNEKFLESGFQAFTNYHFPEFYIVIFALAVSIFTPCSVIMKIRRSQELKNHYTYLRKEADDDN